MTATRAHDDTEEKGGSTMKANGTTERVRPAREPAVPAREAMSDDGSALRVEGLTKRFPQPEGKRRGFWRRQVRRAGRRVLRRRQERDLRPYRHERFREVHAHSDNLDPSRAR